jgi:hypothetical protein
MAERLLVFQLPVKYSLMSTPTALFLGSHIGTSSPWCALLWAGPYTPAVTILSLTPTPGTSSSQGQVSPALLVKAIRVSP